MRRLFLWCLFFMVILNFSGVSRAQEIRKVIVYYFHGTFRCFSCHRIEEFTEGAIKEYFFRELENGTLEYEIINIEEKTFLGKKCNFSILNKNAYTGHCKMCEDMCGLKLF